MQLLTRSVTILISDKIDSMAKVLKERTLYNDKVSICQKDIAFINIRIPKYVKQTLTE